MSKHNDISKRSPEFSSAGTIGLMKDIEAGDAGSVCLKTQVVDTTGKVTHIMTYIRDIIFGTCQMLRVWFPVHRPTLFWPRP